MTKLFNIFCLASLIVSVALYYQTCICNCAHDDNVNIPLNNTTTHKPKVSISSICNSTLILKAVKQYLEWEDTAPLFLLPESRDTVDTRLWINPQYLWCNLLRMENTENICLGPIIQTMQAVCSDKYIESAREGACRHRAGFRVLSRKASAAEDEAKSTAVKDELSELYTKSIKFFVALYKHGYEKGRTDLDPCALLPKTSTAPDIDAVSAAHILKKLSQPCDVPDQSCPLGREGCNIRFTPKLQARIDKGKKYNKEGHAYEGSYIQNQISELRATIRECELSAESASRLDLLFAAVEWTAKVFNL